MMEGQPEAKRRAQRSYGRRVRPHRAPRREEDQESNTCWSPSTGHETGIEKRFVAQSYIRDRRQEKERRSEKGVRGGQRESQPPTARRPEPLKEGMMTTENGTLGQKKNRHGGERVRKRRGIALSVTTHGKKKKDEDKRRRQTRDAQRERPPTQRGAEPFQT